MSSREGFSLECGPGWPHGPDSVAMDGASELGTRENPSLEGIAAAN